MKDERKTKAQLIHELTSARKRIAELERSEKEWKQAEDGLGAALRQWHSTFDAIRDAVSLVDADGKLESCNLAMIELVGQPYENVIGQKYLELFPGGLEPLGREIFSRIQKTRQRETDFLKVGDRWFDVSVDPVIDDAGNFSGSVHVMTDVTERKETEDAYQTLVEQSLQGIMVFREYRIIFANQAAADIIDYTIEDLLAMSAEKAQALTHPEDRARVAGYHRDRMAGKPAPARYDHRVLRKDGTVRWVQASASRIEYEGVPAVQIFYIDITDQKETEDALKRSEEKYRHFIERAAHGMVIIQDNVLAYVNPYGAKAMGFSVEEMTGTSFAEYIHPDERLKVAEYYRRRMQGDTVAPRYETVLVHKDGQRLFVEIDAALTTYEGRLADLVIIRDMTEYKRAEKKLKESEEKFRNLAEHSPNMIFINKGGSVVYANRRCEVLTGYKREELCASDFDFLTLIAPEYISLIKENMNRHMRGEDVDPYEFTIVTREGRRIEAVIAPKIIEYEDETAILGTITDITERKWSEIIQRVQRDIGLALTTSDDIMEVSSGILKAVLQIDGIDSGGVYLVDEPTGAMNLVTHYGLSPDFIIKVSCYEADSPNVRLVMQGEIVYVNQGLSSHDTDMLIKEGLRVLAVIPVKSGRKVLGAFNLASRTLSQFPARTREALETLASQLGIVISRIKAEEAQRESQQMLKNVLDTIPVRVFWKDKNLRYLGSNQVFLDDAGLSSLDELVGKDDYQMNWREFAESYRKDDLNVMEKGLPKLYYEEPGFEPGGETQWRRTSKVPLRDANEEIRGILGISEDITAFRRAEEALRESESRYRELADSITDIFFAMDKDLRYTYWNKASEILTGIPAADALGKSIQEIFPEDVNRMKAVNVYREVLQTQQPQIVVSEFHLAGRDFFFEINVYPTRDGLSVIAKDITDRKEAEEALRLSEERYRTLVDNVDLGINLMNRDYEILMANKKSGLLLKKDVKNFVNAKCYREFEKRPDVCSHCPGRIAMVTGRSSEAETKGVRDDGTTFNVRLNAYPIFGRDNEVEGFVEVVEDITERKRVEETLRESEHRFRELAENIREVFWSFDWCDQKILYVSPAYREVWGRSDSALLDDYGEWRRSIHPDDLHFAEESFQKIVETGGGEPREYRIIQPDGSMRWVSDRGFAVYDENGEVRRIVGIAEDITDRKEAEKQLKTALEEKELLLQEVHHRVKNNLQVVSGLLYIQSQYVEDPQTIKLLNDSQNRIKSMVHVHEQLYQAKNIGKIDFAEYVRNLTAELFLSYGVTGDTIALHIEAANIYFGIDTAIPCGLIVTELVSNSIKHAFPDGQKGEIEITVRTIGEGKTDLIVKDNGIGLPENVDYRTTESMGLYLVNMLVEQIQGMIEVDARGGTMFRITFNISDWGENGHHDG